MARPEGIQFCPFLCGQKFGSNEDYALALHIEEEHTEDSPFVVQYYTEVGPSTHELQKTPPRQTHAPPFPESSGQSVTYSDHDGAASYSEAGGTSKQSSLLPPLDRNDEMELSDSLEPSDEYVMCPEEGCGEEIFLFEFQDHLDFHLAEKAVFEDISLPAAPDTSSGKMQLSLSSSGQDDSSSSPGASLRPSNASSASPPPQSHLDNFSTLISPALRQRLASSTASTISRGRSQLQRSIRSIWDPKSKTQNSTRLGVSYNLENLPLATLIEAIPLPHRRVLSGKLYVLTMHSDEGARSLRLRRPHARLVVRPDVKAATSVPEARHQSRWKSCCHREGRK